jgi:hypothetical protein
MAIKVARLLSANVQSITTSSRTAPYQGRPLALATVRHQRCETDQETEEPMEAVPTAGRPRG